MERNKYNCQLHYFKWQSLSKRIQDCKGNAKELFLLVNKLMGSITQNPLPPNKTDEELAEEFARYFLSKIKKIRETFTNTPSYETLPHNIPRFTSFHPLTESEVHTVIMGMKTTHCKLDIIPTGILKQILEVCLPVITQIVNLSLTNGEFCKSWKVAVVKPLLKKPGLNLISKNYRPILNLPFISKLVEKCMLKQLIEHCENHRLLPDFQSAYRKNYSTETSLIRLTNDILWSMEKQHLTSLTILDLLAAFDTVDHDILLHILEQKFGFCDKALKWFQNYLRPQSFRVSINGKYSTSKNLEFSVPQGSCSGANLFTCYCSLITDSIPPCMTLSGFADNHSIRGSFPARFPTAEKRTISTMEDTLTKIADWMTSMQLKLNSEKTEFILFGSQQMLRHASTEHLNFGTTPIQRSNLIKYLGGHLDASLTFKEHVKQKCKAAMLNFIKIKAIRHSLTTAACHTLVLMLCISHFDYANALLYGMTKKLKSRY